MASMTSNFQASALNNDVNILISVENHVTQEFLLEPSIHTNEIDFGILYANAIHYALEAHGLTTFIDTDWGHDLYFDELLSITDKNGNIIVNENGYEWFVYFNGEYHERISYYDEIKYEDEFTIRLIYSSKESNQNSDELIQKLAFVNLDQRPELTELYQEGLELLLKNLDYAEYLVRLDEALNPKVKAESIDILDGDFRLFVNDIHTLNYKVFPENHTEEVTFTSSDESVATIDENGIIQALNKGETIITVHAGDMTESIGLTVEEVKAESISFDEPSIQLNVGSQLSLNPTILPSNATSSPTYEIKNDGILKLEHNRIIALKEGTTIVTAIVDGLTADLEVHVEGEVEYTEPTVVFKHTSGAITTATDNVFNLSILDEGKFELLGADDIDLVDGVPYWDASKKNTRRSKRVDSLLYFKRWYIHAFQRRKL